MKTSKQLVQLCLGVLLSLPAIANAQTTIQTSVGDVTDNRTTGSFNAECTVELKFTGDAAMDAGTVHKIRLSEATDEAGHDLILKDNDDSATHSFDSDNSSGALKAEVKLRNPSRSANTIKILKGEVELFKPTEANGGLLTITNILQHPAEPVQNAALAKYGIQIIYLTKESYEAKKKEIEAQQNTGQKMGAAFGELFTGMFGSMMSDSKNSIQMYVKDPDKRVVGLKFTDGQGKPLESNESMSSDDFKSTSFDTPPPADTRMIVQLATPESLKSYPFKVENIPLP